MTQKSYKIFMDEIYPKPAKKIHQKQNRRLTYR